jgi:hypothetical protein
MYPVFGISYSTLKKIVHKEKLLFAAFVATDMSDQDIIGVSLNFHERQRSCDQAKAPAVGSVSAACSWYLALSCLLLDCKVLFPVFKCMIQ